MCTTPLGAVGLLLLLSITSTVQAIPAAGVPNQRWAIGQPVVTSSGLVQGHAGPNNPQVSEYLGIPFADPPLGELRFEAPKKYYGLSTINGTSFGFSCLSNATGGTLDVAALQALGLTPAAPTIASELAGHGLPQSEDCLTLNIWSKPQTGDRYKAVLVWIYGGGFEAGSSAIPLYNGQYLADTQDVVVVTFNYRASIFGFPGIPGKPANLAILDQRLALEWVHDNIASFGGDPERVVLFGQSAGASAVDLHSYAYADEPLVSGYIAESGTVFSFTPSTDASASALWYETSTNANCTGTPAAVLACMKSLPAEDVLRTAAATAAHKSGVKEGNTSASAANKFYPTVDNLLVFPDYATRCAAALPVLVGSNDNEAGLFRLSLPNETDAYWDAFTRQFTCPAAARAVAGLNQGVPTWRYRYFGSFPNLQLTTTPDSGAWHGSEMLLIFNTMPQTVLTNTNEETSIAAYVQGAWATFAKDSRAGLSAYDGGWPHFGSTTQSLIRLGFRNQTGTNLVQGNYYDALCTSVPGLAT